MSGIASPNLRRVAGAGKPFFVGALSVICPTGKSPNSLSSPSRKNIPLRAGPDSNLYPRHPVPLRGAARDVTDAGRDAVDADARLTGEAEADGEVVWS
jgi:hypothetical protein